MKHIGLTHTILSGGSLLRALEHQMIAKHCQNLKGVGLDLGSGGSAYRKFLGSECQVQEADINPLSKADHIFDANKPFPLKDESFDFIFCINVLEHLYHPKSALKEFSRVLKKGGTLFLSYPFMFPYHASDVSEDNYRFTHQFTQKSLAESGFQNIQIERLGGRFSVILEIMAQSVPRLFQRLIRTPYIFLKNIDRQLISKNEKKNGAYFYLGTFTVAKK
jgi:SAM-dependent methyltransferase